MVDFLVLRFFCFVVEVVGARRCPSVDFGGFFGSSLFFFVSSVPVGARRCPSVDGGIFVFFGFFLDSPLVDFGGFFSSLVLFFCFLGAHRWMVDFFGFVDAFMVLVAVVGAMGRVEVPWPSRVW